jgi:hypothetical protein
MGRARPAKLSYAYCPLESTRLLLHDAERTKTYVYHHYGPGAGWPEDGCLYVLEGLPRGTALQPWNIALPH